MLLVVYVGSIMSINVTVNANPMSVNRGRMLLTDVNEFKKQELNRRRKMRIEQVRQQSKDIASNIRKRVQQKKDNVLKAAEMKENSELQNCQERKLKSLQQKYHECLDEVGLAHTHAALQPDPVSVLAAQIERITDQAKIRGKQALEKQKAENRKATENEELHKSHKKSVRTAEDIRSANIVAGKKMADDRAERVPLKSVNVQRALPSNIVRPPPMTTGPEEAQQTARATGHRAKGLLQHGARTSDSSTLTSGSDEELLVPCYEFEPATSSKYNRKSDVVDHSADFGKVLKNTEQTSGRRKPQFVELPEVIAVDDRETPDSQEKKSDEYLVSSDQSSTSHSPTSYSGNSRNTADRDRQPAPAVVNSESSGVKLDPSRISTVEQRPVLRPMLSEQSINSETASHLSRPRTVPVWQSKDSLRCATTRQVHFYDHSSRYQQQCYHPKDVVQKVDEPFQKTAVQIAEEITAASEAMQKEKLKAKLRQEQLQQCWSSQALARERLKRQYDLLLSELETLSRKERLARAQNVSATAPAIHMSEERLKERGNTRQKNMDSAFERVYYRSSEAHSENDADTGSGLQGKISEALSDKQKNIAVESEVKLNVGCCIPPRAAVQPPTAGKEPESPKVMHSTEVSGSNEDPKKPEKSRNSQAPYRIDLTDEVDIRLEKSRPLNSKLPSVRQTDLGSVATISEAHSVSISFSSQTSSSSSVSDFSSNREMSKITESKILNSKHKIDVLKNDSSKQTGLTSRISLSECSGTVLNTSVPQVERKEETPKVNSEEEFQRDGPSKHYEPNDGEDCKKLGNSAHNEQLPRHATKSERLKLIKNRVLDSKKLKRSFERAKLSSFSSSSSLASEHSVLERGERCLSDPEGEASTTSADIRSPYDDVKIVVKVRDKSQELHGNKTLETVDSGHLSFESNTKSKERKHCKEHCAKKGLYSDVYTKEPQTQSEKKKSFEIQEDLYSSGASNSPEIISGQAFDPVGHMSIRTQRLTGKKSTVRKPHIDNQVEGNKLHNESNNLDNNLEKQDEVFKELDETMNVTSASTSYFSPPEKMSTARAKEIESAMDAISSFELNTQRSEQTILYAQTNVNPQLNCYIRRLLAMSRESVENLSVSISDSSTQAEEIVYCSTEQHLNNAEFKNASSRRDWVSILSDRNADEKEVLTEKASDMKRDAEQTIDSCETGLKMSHQAVSSAVCDSNGNGVQLIAPESSNGHSEESRNSNTIESQGKNKNVEHRPELESEKVLPSDDSTVIEVNHDDLIVAMNKRIISAINEINSTVSSVAVDPNVLQLEKPVSNSCKQNIAESKVATDISSPQTDLNELAEKYSKRVSDLSKKLEHLRLEKQQILEMSSSGSDREVCDATAYSSPPPKVSIVADTKPSLISLYQPEYVQPPVMSLDNDAGLTSHKERNGPAHNLRAKPPVSLSQKLIRDICTPHELSTIIEVDTPQVPQKQADTATELVTSVREDKMSGSNIPEVSVTTERNSNSLEEWPLPAEDKSLSDSAGDVVRDIMTELLRRKLLTSPYHWLKDEYEKKHVEHGSSVAEESPPNQATERENFATRSSKENLSSSHNVSDTAEQTSFQISSKSGNSNFEEKCPLADTSNTHQTDLHNVFENLGIGWANSMLRKTRQAMTYSSSSSENSRNFSTPRRKNSLKDTKTSKEKHQALSCENSKSAVNEDVLQYKKKDFVCATLGSKDVPMQISSSSGSSVKSNISRTRDTEISTARDESVDDEHLTIKVPNISLTTKLKVSLSGSNSLS